MYRFFTFWYRGYNYIPTYAPRMLGDSRNSVINWYTEGYTWLGEFYDEFGGDGSFWPRKVLSHTRVPIDLDEWYFVVATYNPNINEFGTPDINYEDYIIGCQDSEQIEIDVDTYADCCGEDGGLCSGEPFNYWNPNQFFPLKSVCTCQTNLYENFAGTRLYVI